MKDLQSLLRSTLGNELIVESYATKDLLPPGENYGSKILSIDVLIKKNKEAKVEHLYLVAKTPLPLSMETGMFDMSVTFKKEIFMYSNILPYYRKLEIKNGIKEEAALNISPMYYGSRLSLNPHSDYDSDAAILFENLKTKGYYCADRRHGCDLAHAKWAIEAMARFHALGLATKEKDPEFFEILKVRSKCIDMNSVQWEPVIRRGLKSIADDPITSQYYEKCAQVMSKSSIDSWMAIPPEPWSTIIHSDFWVNNIMYHQKEGESEPDDIKLIDYQNYLFLSPTRELAFFVSTQLDHDTIGHIDELINLYYNTLVERLKLLNCDVEPYCREIFDKNLRENAATEFPHGLCMLKIITMNIDADDPNPPNIMNVVEHNNDNEMCKIRRRDFIKIYIDKGWLS